MPQPPEPTLADNHPGRGLWIGLALGGPIMVYAIIELASKSGTAGSVRTGEWLIGGLLTHDLVIAPLIIATVWATCRALPARVRAPVCAGVLGTALVITIGAPALLGYGHRPDNPTVHPLDYTTAVLTAVTIVWTAVLLVTLVKTLSGWWIRRRSRT